MTHTFCPKCGGNLTEKALFSSVYFECTKCDSAEATVLKPEPKASAMPQGDAKSFGLQKSPDWGVTATGDIDPRDLDNFITDGGTPGVFSAQKSAPMTSKTPTLEVTEGGMVWQPIYDNRTGREIGRLFLRNVGESGK